MMYITVNRNFPSVFSTRYPNIQRKNMFPAKCKNPACTNMEDSKVKACGCAGTKPYRWNTATEWDGGTYVRMSTNALIVTNARSTYGLRPMYPSSLSGKINTAVELCFRAQV